MYRNNRSGFSYLILFMKNIVFPFYLKLACVLIILVAGGYLVIIGKEVLLPLLFAFLFALLLLPLCNFLENRLRFSKICLFRCVGADFSCSYFFYHLFIGFADNGSEPGMAIAKTAINGLFHNRAAMACRQLSTSMRKSKLIYRQHNRKVLNSSGTIIGKNGIIGIFDFASVVFI